MASETLHPLQFPVIFTGHYCYKFFSCERVGKVSQNFAKRLCKPFTPKSTTWHFSILHPPPRLNFPLIYRVWSPFFPKEEVQAHFPKQQLVIKPPPPQPPQPLPPQPLPPPLPHPPQMESIIYLILGS